MATLALLAQAFSEKVRGNHASLSEQSYNAFCKYLVTFSNGDVGALKDLVAATQVIRDKYRQLGDTSAVEVADQFLTAAYEYMQTPDYKAKAGGSKLLMWGGIALIAYFILKD